MDERQQQIKEGAGLDESRINQDFVDWLKTWGPRIMIGVAVIALGYAGYTRFQQYRADRIDNAYIELEQAIVSGSPRVLVSVADEYSTIRSVPELARLRAADQYLHTVRRGVQMGAQFDPQGNLVNPEEDLLTQEDKDAHLAEARALYARVLADTEGKAGKELFTLQALYGLAAVDESRGDFEAARARLERVVSLAERAGFTEHVTIARRRLDTLGELDQLPRVFTEAELPEVPALPQRQPFGMEGLPEELRRQLEAMQAGQPMDDPIGPAVPGQLPPIDPQEPPPAEPPEDPHGEPSEDPPVGEPSEDPPAPPPGP